MKAVLLSLLLGLFFVGSKAQNCDIATGGVSIVNANNTAPASSGCVGQVLNFKFYIANLGTSPTCTIPANSVTAVFDFPTLSGNVKPYIYNGPATFTTGYFTWTYDPMEEVLVGKNTTAIPNGNGDVDILIKVIGNAPGGTASSALNLTQGGATSDNTGNNTGSAQLTINASPTATIAYSGTPYCNIGTATVTQTGQGGGTYSSTPGGLSINNTTGAINLAASTPGSYTVTYSFSNGTCSNTTTTGVTVTAAPTATLSYIGNPFCTTASPASPTLTGTGAYTGGSYSSTGGLTIDGGSGVITPSTSTPGTYMVSYTTPASGGCAPVTTTTSVTITATPATPTVSVTQPTCSTPTGTITVNSPTGGDITYSINGTNYQVSNTFSNLVPGSYSVTAKNTSGCVSSATMVTVNAAPASPAMPTVTVTQPTCSTPTGTITVNSPTGGDITYSINGTNYQVSNTFSNLVPGSYSVTAKNGSGCVSSATMITVNAAPATPAMPTVTVTQPTCAVATGSITVNTPTGGDITYSINGTNYQVSNTFSNLVPGSYNITAKNSSGCVSSATMVTVNAAPASPAMPTVTVTQPTCSTPTGTITVNSPTGGDITYSINGTNYQSGNTFSNLVPGSYSVTAKNGSGCVSSATMITINAAPATPATPTVTVVQPTCAVATGSITVNTPTGSDITYSIDGTTYQSGNTFSNLVPGSYNVTAKNTSGCVSSATMVTVNAAPASPATPTVTVTQPTCAVATGSITVNSPTGGDITYSIDGTTYQSGNTFSNLASGSYSVTAKNGSGCVSSVTTVTVNAAPASPAMPTVTVTQPTCSVATGTITVNSPTGGDITYSINGTTYQASNVFNNVVPGNYSVTAKNTTSGCVSAATSVTINAAPASPAMPTVTVTQPTCSVATGTITVNSPTGSDITYSINGTNYQSGNTFSNLTPGSYSVTAKNTSGCVSASIMVTINPQPATPATPTVMVTQPTCAVATGSITVNSPTGGDITYSIDGTTYQSGNTFSNLAPGSYSVTAKNGSGCVSSATMVTINAAPASPALVAGATTITAQSCMPGNGVIDPDETVTVSFCIQNNGCATTNLVGTLQNTGGVTAASGPQNYGAVPNGGSPVCRSFTFTANGACGSTITASISLQDGTTNLGTLTYTFTLGVITQNPPVSFTNSASITIPASGTSSPYPSNITVSGITNPVAKVTVQLTGLNHAFPDDVDILLVGPTGQKLLLMSDAGGGSTYDLTNATLIFDDAAASSIPDEDPIPSNATTTYKPTDYVGDDGEESLPAPAPARPYIGTLSTFNGLNPNGIWSLYVSDDFTNDAGSITGGWTLNITTSTATCCVTPQIVITAPTVTQPTCTTPTGTIVVNATGSGTLEYSIDNGATYQLSNTFSGLTPGNYNIKVRQQANPSNSTTYSGNPVVINAAPAVPAMPTVTVTQPTCSVATGSITVNSPTGGDITYSINGTNYQVSNTFSNLAQGSYSVTAKNGSGCVSAVTTVTVNAAPASPATPTVTVTQPTCSVATGTITVNSPTGGDITYSIDGTTYQSGNTFSNLASGSYSVTAKNGSGCVSSVTTVTINAAPASPAMPTVTVTQPTCSVATGTITVNSPTGGDITYSIDGTTYQSGNTFSNLAQGSYSVTAKNGSGCVSSATMVTVNAAPATPAMPTVTVTQPTCSIATGTITVNSPTGSDITYSINGTNYQSSNTFSNLAPGSYNVTAKNTTSGCVSASTTVTINAAPASPAAPTVTVVQPTCSAPTGTITVNTPTGGDITYSINGTTYQASNVFNNVVPGNYSVTAKNTTSGCVSAATSVTINAAPASPAMPTVTVTQPTCPGASGTITINSPTGAGITYSINGTTYQAGNVFSNVAPGNYSVTAKNSSGCVSTATPVTTNAGPADTQAPTIVLKSNPTVFLTAANTYTVQLSDVLQSVGDNCDPNPSATVSTLQVTCNNLGAGSGSGTPHQAYVSNTTVGNANYDGQFGMSFKVNSANGVVIDKLGAFDDQGNGISGNQSGGVRVAIFNIATQAIVSGLDVTIAGTTDPLVGNYRMRSITPVTLAPGNYAIITKGYVGEKFYNRNLTGPLNPAGDNAGGALTFLNTVYYGNAPAFGFPNNSGDAGNPNEYIAGTFNYALSASNNVTITATDVSGNTSTATATVTVIDSFYVLTTKTATVNLNASGQATIAAADVLQSLKNNCGVDVTSSTLQVSPSSFTCADISSGGLTPSPDNHQAYVSNTMSGNANYDGQFGMSFKVNDANGVSIDKLGAFDDGGNGITGNQGGGVRVAIFNIATQAIVPGLDVTISGTTDPLVGSYRMRSITPVTLAPGNYAIITKGYVGEKFYNRNLTGPLNPAGDNAGGALTFLNTVYYGNVAAFGFPDNSGDAGNPNEYISGTFNYKTLVTTGTTVTLTATDVYGNKKQATAQVVVKDVTGPTVITKNITLNLNSSGNASITASDVLQTPVTDNCAVQSVTVSPNSFTCADYSGSGNNGTPHQAYISNTAVGNSNYDGQFGMSFKVNSANGIVIDKLGAFDDQGNGITGSQGGGVRVAIFNIATQAIVSGLDVTISGTTDPLVGSYRMRSITPVTLPAGNYVIITKGYVGEKFYNRNLTGPLNPAGDNAGGALTFLNTVYYGNAAAFGFPDNSGDAGNPNEYISGTFNYALNVSNNKIVTVTATDTHGNVTTATATVTLTNTSNSCATPAPVMAYAARSVQTEAPVVLDNVSMTVKVYPNPSSGQFTVQLYSLKATKVSLQVMDANGQVVVQREASLSSKTPVLSIPVDISKHASGIYLIKVISADGVQTAKVVVSR